jgi:Alpha/beta hydrolase domain
VQAHAKVRGPITGGRRGWPFGAAAFDLNALDYVEQEWIFAGDAACYRHTPGTGRSFDGRWEIEPAQSVPFATRMLVRRPRDAARFNGTVVVFWANVSIGFDIYTGESSQLYEGCAFVGVTTQRTAVEGYRDGPQNGLTSWDPERYGDLTIATDDASYDIFTQAARLVGRDRQRGGLDPLGGLDVRHLIAFGASQSAGRLATYINAVQPLAAAFDGFLLDVYFGNGTPVDTSAAPAAGVTRVEQITELIRRHGLPPGGHLLRDVGVPVFVVNSESESLAHFPVRQPDTDTYRFWEFAGHAHGTVPSKETLRSSWERDLGITHHPMAPTAGYNALSLEPGRAAALAHMLRWLDDATPPPVQPRIRIEGDPPRIIRDDLGNALGGIRMPAVAVPTGRNSGFAADGTLSLFGSTEPFDSARLHALYRDHDAYAAAFKAAAAEAVQSGVLLAPDAESLVTEATAAAIP